MKILSCFLDNLKTKKRKNIVKERESLKKHNVSLVIKKGDEICNDDLNLFFECYLNTINKKWSIAYLNLPFFNQLVQSTIKQKIVLIQAFQKKSLLDAQFILLVKKFYMEDIGVV